MLILDHLKKKNLHLFILVLMILLGTALRGYNLFVPVADWHSFRQADTISVSRVYLEEGVDILKPKYHDLSNTQSGMFNPEGYRMVEFPAYNLIITFFHDMFPFFSLEVWGRITSIISVSLTSYFIFLLMKRFTSYKIGMLSAFIYLTIPFNIFFTRVILPEPIATMFSVAALWFFVRFIDNEKISDLYFSAILMAIGILIKPYVFFYAFPMMYLLTSKTGLKNILKTKYIVYSLIIVLPFVFWRFWISQYPEGIPFWKWTLNGDGIRFKPAFFRWIFSERIGKLILGVWGVFLFVFGLSGGDKKARFFQSLMLGVFIYLSLFATANVRHDYYQTIIIPAIIMVFSYGCFVFIKSSYSNTFKVLAGSVVIFLMLVTTTGLVKEYYKINRPEIVRAGLATRDLVPADSLVIAPYNGDTAFLYQTRRKGWPVVDFPIDELINRGAEYFVSVDLNHYQTIEFMEKYEIVKKTDSFVIINLSENK